MSFPKSSDFISYKFKALKTFASNEWLADGKKKYRQVFDQNELSFVYVEFSFYNKLFDEADWDALILLKAFRKGKTVEEICSLELAKHISQTQNIVYLREQQGHDKPGEYWKEGDYYWEAYIDGILVGTTNFYVYDVGAVNSNQNLYLDVQSVQLYEGTNAHRGRKDAIYYTEFQDRETRYVWVELKLENLYRKKSWMCEMNFLIYNDARQLKGQMKELIEIPANSQEITIHSGWGSDLRGTWFADNYTVEILFMDTLLGVSPFKVASRFEQGTPPFIRVVDPSNLSQGQLPQELATQSLDHVLKDLDELIGLDGIKKRIREYAQYLSFLKLRKEKGFKDEQPIQLHAVFMGNPGTGKTTIARMLGRIYKKLGLLSRDHVHEVDRADIIGEYIGQTAPKMRAAIEKARGGILFIDEAYALYRSPEDTKDYGREAIELLVKEMSAEKGDLAIIVAGYPKEMETFLNSNPGLKSRFTMRYDFQDYSPTELEEIARQYAQSLSVNLTSGARQLLHKKLTDAYRDRDRTFGNARYVQSIINEAKMNLGLRVMKTEHPNELTREALSMIRKADLLAIFESESRSLAQIPIDEALLSTAMDELDRMIGLSQVKTEIHELVKVVRFYREIGKDVLNRFSLHSVFTGNPGTGKTTVARIVGKIYKALGILERGHVVECDRQALVAGHVGQTAIKTAEVIEEARGGVLFIDEAYSLTQGGDNDFGREAVESLLKRMEDLRGELVVIAVGYPENMRHFLEANPGLKSRFDRKLNFPDYSPADLLEIARLMFSSEHISLPDETAAVLLNYFKFLDRTKNRFFGNARAVRKVVEKAIKNQHLRLANLPQHKRRKKMLQELRPEDVAEFVPGNDSLLEGGKQGKMGF